MGILAKLGTAYSEIQYPDENVDYITHGSYVDIELNGKHRSFFIGTHRLPSLEKIDGVENISSASPLGTVLLGRKIGENIAWQLPNGNKMNATIIKVDQNKMRYLHER